MEQTGFESMPKELRETPLMRVAAEMHRMRDEQRTLILVASGFLEVLVNAVIDAKCKNANKITGNNRDFPFSVKLVLLNEMNLMTDVSFANINWLRKVRNRAAHDAFFEV